MPAEVLYRKWRPQRFADVAGQEPITRTLRNAVAAGKVSHAYLFSGPRGTGKTTTARILAKAVNCERPDDGEPCGQCRSCVEFAEGRAMDLIELDAASNRGIDEVRGIREKANYAPAIGPHKVYLIDEVHMLTEPAFNALLKTLEEPPPHVIFVLATTELQKVPATILSRCQRFDFRRIPVSAMADRLEEICAGEGISCPREGLEEIARLATGSARDAVNLLEQLVDYRGRSLTMDDVRAVLELSGDERASELAAHALHGRLAEGLETIAAVRDDGVDLRRFQRDVVAALRELLLIKSGVDRHSRRSAPELDAMRAIVADVPVERIVAALRAFGEADLRADPLSPLPLELALACTIVPQSEPAVAPAAAPRPAAPAAPAPSADASLIERIRAEASALDKRLAGWINGSCYVESFEGGVLTLAFYDTYSLHKSKVESPPVKDFIERVAANVLGEPVKLRCIMSERRPKGGHTIERLVQEHGARIVSRE